VQELCRERSHLEAALQREIAKRRAVEVDKTKAEARVKDTESKLAEVERRLKVEQVRNHAPRTMFVIAASLKLFVDEHPVLGL
jgi:hypothetical protein